MKIETDEFGERLRVNGEEFIASGDLEFEVLASRLSGARLSDLPRGVSVILCDRIIGSREIHARSPICTFQHTPNGEFVAHGETPFFLESETSRQMRGRNISARQSPPQGALSRHWPQVVG